MTKDQLDSSIVVNFSENLSLKLKTFITSYHQANKKTENNPFCLLIWSCSLFSDLIKSKIDISSDFLGRGRIFKPLILFLLTLSAPGLWILVFIFFGFWIEVCMFSNISIFSFKATL